jgi:hypothetical protein
MFGREVIEGEQRHPHQWQCHVHRLASGEGSLAVTAEPGNTKSSGGGGGEL